MHHDAPTWLDHQRTTIEARLATLESRVQRIGDHYKREADAGVGGIVDHAQAHEDDEVVGDLEALAETEVPALRHALERITLGTYETCTSCGEPIGRPRLEAKPEATTCAACARQRESARA